MNVEVTSVYEKITRPNNHVQADALLRRAIELLQGAPPMLLTQHDGDVRMRGALPIIAQQITTDRVALQTLTATGLTYRYPGSAHGVEAVDLSIRRGQFVVITERIGSGKSTLLRVLLGLLPTQEGAVHWNDRLVDNLAAFMVLPQVAYTPQTPRLFSETLRDNLLMGLNADGEPLQQALYQAVLDRDVPRLDHGLKPWLDRAGCG
jgi:ATP-binding cassette subfamily B protein